MATRTGTSAPLPTATPPSDNLGIFVTALPIGYVEPLPATVARMQELLRDITGIANQRLLRDLLVIKLLMPVESKDLVIYNVPMAASFISKLKSDLVTKYYTR